MFSDGLVCETELISDWFVPFINQSRPGGLEPPACGLENRCSILLSYGRIDIFLYFYNDTKTFALIYSNYCLYFHFTRSNHGRIIIVVLQDISTLIRFRKKFKICCFRLYSLTPAIGCFRGKFYIFHRKDTHFGIIIGISILTKLREL